MRQLAAASGVNVATIYHYFPSKADVLRSVVEERRYSERLDAETPPLSTDAPPRERLVELLDWFWRRTLEAESVWRLLVGESIRGEAAAPSTTAELVGSLAATPAGGCAAGFPRSEKSGGGA